MYTTIEITLDKETKKAVTTIAKENKVTVNQVICDCLFRAVWDNLFEDSEKWEQFRKECSKKNASKDTMKIVEKIFKEVK